jgi:hypothetical protein
MLMVIFGAGASYDSSPDLPPPTSHLPVPAPAETWRPPLARELFLDHNGVFGEMVQRYPKLLPILPHLRRTSNSRSVEQELELFRDQARNGDAERTRQLFSVRYYLSDILSKVTEQWLKRTNCVTNYVSLLDQIRHIHKGNEPVCLVTFNYDLLLDRALQSFDYRAQSPERFDAHPVFKVFKPHGSVNWARLIEGPLWYRDSGGPEIRLGPQQLIEQAQELKLSDSFVLANATDSNQVFNFSRPIVPAIAIPVQTKTDDTFEWPSSHCAYLKDLLRSVTKILIIGWQGKEAHFCRMLRSFLPPLGVTQLMVVGANEHDAGGILTHFVGEIGQVPGRPFLGEGGFSQFVANQEGQFFLEA